MTCTRSDIPFGVGLVSRFIEALTTSQVAKEYFGTSKVLLTLESLVLVGYCDIDWASDVDDLKVIPCLFFFP